MSPQSCAATLNNVVGNHAGTVLSLQHCILFVLYFVFFWTALYCILFVGQRLVKEISIQNISPNSLELSSSILDPHGPFMLLSANRTLESMETHQCVVSFTPQCAQEVIHVIYCANHQWS